MESGSPDIKFQILSGVFNVLQVHVKVVQGHWATCFRSQYQQASMEDIEHTWFVPQDPVKTELRWDITASSATRLATATRSDSMGA